MTSSISGMSGSILAGGLPGGRIGVGVGGSKSVGGELEKVSEKTVPEDWTLVSSFGFNSVSSSSRVRSITMSSVLIGVDFASSAPVPEH